VPIIAYPRLKRELSQDEIDQEMAISNRGQELYQRLGDLADKQQVALSPREGSKGWLDKVWVERPPGDFAIKIKSILIAADIVELDEEQGHRSVITNIGHSIVGLDANGYLMPPTLNHLLEPAQREEIMDRIASTADALEAVITPASLSSN
jgi:hypothetical protein